MKDFISFAIDFAVELWTDRYPLFVALMISLRVAVILWFVIDI